MTTDLDPLWAPIPETQGRPLDGIKVLDLSRVMAGPYCAMLLGDLGATVVKVEGPAGDETRRWGPPFRGGTATYYFAANRNKRGIRLDLTNAGDRERFESLLRGADVLVHNFTGEVQTRLGLTPPELADLNPGCILCNISGFGPDQPDRRGFDVATQALGGLMAVTGPVGGPPTKVGVPISDLAAGLFAALAITACLAQRSEPTRGRRVEVALLDTVVALLSNQAMSWLAGGVEPGLLGNDHPHVAPYGLYQTGAGSLVIAAGADRHFQRLCTLLEAPELARDPRFRSNPERVANREELRRELEARLAGEDAETWRKRLEGEGVPCGVVRSVAAVFDDLGADAVAEVDGIPQVVGPIRIDGERLRPYLPPPGLEPD